MKDKNKIKKKWNHQKRECYKRKNKQGILQINLNNERNEQNNKKQWISKETTLIEQKSREIQNYGFSKETRPIK